MAALSDVARLNLLIETLTDFASVPDVDRLTLALGTRARFLVSFSRCVILLGYNTAEPSRLAVVQGHGVPAAARIDDLSPVEAALATRALATLLPAVNDLRRPSVACYPLTSLGSPLGALIFTTDRATYSMSDLRTVQALAGACASVVARIGMGAALAEQLERIREDERTRIARELHDELGQTLIALKLDSERIRDGIAQPSKEGRARVRAAADSMASAVDTTLEAVERIVSELRPAVLDALGLEAAVEWLVAEFTRRTGIPASCRCGDEEEMAPAVATALFRILQEALTNVAKHAHASAVDVVLVNDGQTVVLTITDDGCGVSEAGMADPSAHGLRGMRERLRALDGTFAVTKRSGGGTELVARCRVTTWRT